MSKRIPDRLEELVRARRACVRIVTFEEADARDAAFEAAARLGLEAWTWSSIRGLRIGPAAVEPVEGTTHPAGALMHCVLHATGPTMAVFCDLGEHLADPLVARPLRELIDAFEQRRATATASCVVMIDTKDHVPPPIEACSTVCRDAMPDDKEIEGLLRKTLRELHRQRPLTIELRDADVRAMVENLRGLERRHIRQLVADAVTSDGRLDPDDIGAMARGKRDLLRSAGVLEAVDAPAALEDIGGLIALKRWLGERQRSFDPEAAAFGLSAPRGVLLLGVQGAGKSLAAKAIATAWKRPLMRLDPGALYDRYVGESESRLRDALRQAEAMAPVVLWIDEIEKGFASAASRSVDGGLSQRMFGTLLTWMQERTAPVFLVATANDIEALPAELLRKGRFDEIFFVDLPDAAAREQVFAIHLRKRRRTPGKFDLPALAAASEGFSGAEIEQAVVSALFRAFNAGRALTTEDIVAATQESAPLSVVMAGRVAALREWARERCVAAG